MLCRIQAGSAQESQLSKIVKRLASSSMFPIPTASTFDIYLFLIPLLDEKVNNYIKEKSKSFSHNFIDNNNKKGKRKNQFLISMFIKKLTIIK